jgi:hypothetical protein
MGRIASGPYVQARVKKTEDGWALEVLGAPYGGHIDGKDAQGDYFSEETDFMLQEGDQRPVLYYHGADELGRPTTRPEVIGTATVSKRDAMGLWFDVVLDKAKEFSKRIYEAAVNGLARASTGAINYLVRRNTDGELLSWPIGELTLIDRSDMRRPANELAVAHLKTAYIQSGLEYPEAFAKSEELEASAVERFLADKENLKEIAIRRQNG